MKSPSFQSGFSLIELLISMTIFSVVVTMSTGTLLVLLDANSKAQNSQAVLGDLTIAIDSMTREIRTGDNYFCDSKSGWDPVEGADATRDCPVGSTGNYISIIELDGSLTAGAGSNRVSYYYDAADQAIYRRIGNLTPVQLTSRNIRITDAEFIVTGTDNSAPDVEQPSVTIYITGEAGELAEVDADFVLQTTVTQRALDIP